MSRTSQKRWGRAFAVLAVAAAALCIVAAVLDAGRMAAGDFQGEEPAGTSELLLAGGGRVLGLRRVVPRTTEGFFGEDAAIFGQRHERGGPKRASEAANGDGGAKPGEEEGSIASGGEGGDAPKEDGEEKERGGVEEKQEGSADSGGEASKEQESPPQEDANEFGIEPDDAAPAEEGDGAAPGKLGDGGSGKLKGVIGDDGEEEEEEEGHAKYEEPVWGETPPPGRSTEFLRGLVGQVEADETMPTKASKKLKLSERTVEAAEQQLAVAKRMRMDAAAEREQAATLSKHLDELKEWREKNDERAAWFDKRAEAAQEDVEEEKERLEAFETGEKKKGKMVLGEFQSNAERHREEIARDVKRMVRKMRGQSSRH